MLGPSAIVLILPSRTYERELAEDHAVAVLIPAPQLRRVAVSPGPVHHPRGRNYDTTGAARRPRVRPATLQHPLGKMDGNPRARRPRVTGWCRRPPPPSAALLLRRSRPVDRGERHRASAQCPQRQPLSPAAPRGRAGRPEARTARHAQPLARRCASSEVGTALPAAATAAGSAVGHHLRHCDRGSVHGKRSGSSTRSRGLRS